MQDAEANVKSDEVDEEDSGKSKDKEDENLEEEAKSEEKSEVNPTKKSTEKRKETSKQSDSEKLPGNKPQKAKRERKLVGSSATLSIEKKQCKSGEKCKRFKSEVKSSESRDDTQKDEGDKVLKEDSGGESQSGKEDEKLFTSSKKQNVEKEHEDTSLVAKEKMDSKKESIKSSTKDQGKGQASKDVKAEPTRSEMHEALIHIVLNLAPDTMDQMIAELGAHFNMDLWHREEEVRSILGEIIDRLQMAIIEESGDEADKEEQENGEDGEEQEETRKDDKDA